MVVAHGYHRAYLSARASSKICQTQRATVASGRLHEQASNTLSDNYPACQEDKHRLHAFVTTATGDVRTLSPHRLAFVTLPKPFE